MGCALRSPPSVESSQSPGDVHCVGSVAPVGNLEPRDIKPPAQGHTAGNCRAGFGAQVWSIPWIRWGLLGPQCQTSVPVPLGVSPSSLMEPLFAHSPLGGDPPAGPWFSVLPELQGLCVSPLKVSPLPPRPGPAHFQPGIAVFSSLSCIFQAPPGEVYPAAAGPESVHKQVFPKAPGSDQAAAGT